MTPCARSVVDGPKAAQGCRTGQPSLEDFAERIADPRHVIESHAEVKGKPEQML